jgi:hypothetical protein
MVLLIHISCICEMLEMYKKCSLPVHFSLVLDDLITNRNIEYGSDDSISITIIFFFLIITES